MRKQKMVKRYFLVIWTILSMFFAAGAETPWDIILLDVSEDFMSAGEENHKKESYSDGIMQELSKIVPSDGKLMLFAKGRSSLHFGDYEKEVKNKLDLLSNVLGKSTYIYDAAGSVINLEKRPKRILIITNGISTDGSFSAETMGEIMRDNDIIVDAILYPRQGAIKLDGVDVTDRFPLRNPEAFIKFIKKTGGKICHIDVNCPEDHGNLEKRINDFVKEVSMEALNNGVSVHRSDLDKEMVKKTVSRLKPEKLIIMEVDTAVNLRYNDIVYNGLRDIERRSKIKDSMVGADSQDYPCFDSSDAIYENRDYSNYVFGESEGDKTEKLSLLKKIKGKGNYCKLSDNIPLRALPMVYYSGTGTTMLICGFDIEYVDSDPDDSEEETEE